jgi:glycosyltransferase involved in cell wall biosynthesis
VFAGNVLGFIGCGSGMSVVSRVRHLTSVHQIGDNRIFYREAKSLADAGYDVALVVGQVSIGPVAGVKVIGVGPARNRVARATRTVWKVFRAARRERADIYHLHDPELLWAGVLLKLLGHHVVYDVHEDAPKQIMNKPWIPGWARQVLSVGTALVERAAAEVLDGVVTATPSIAERFPAGKTVVVQNFPRVAAARVRDDVPGFDSPPHTFAYTGQLTAVQGLREILATAALLPPDLGNAVVAGFFDDNALEREARGSEGWKRIRFLGRVTPDEVLDVIQSARCGLVIDHPISNYLESYSTKMFEYMACGVPVVCSDFPFWQRIIAEADCGVTVDPMDPEAVAKAVESLCRDPDEARRLGDNGRRAILERYNWENEFTKLDDLYRRMM